MDIKKLIEAATEHDAMGRRHADKIGRPAGDTPAVMRADAAHIEDLERELRAAEIRLHDVATLCANVESELAEIKRRTYVAVTCNHVGRMERAEARVAELEAEREKQKPVAAQAEGYVTALRYIAWEAAGYMDCVHAAKRAIGEMGALPPPPKIQPTEAGG